MNQIAVMQIVLLVLGCGLAAGFLRMLIARRASPRIHIQGRFERDIDGSKRLVIDLVNAGPAAVTINAVMLLRHSQLAPLITIAEADRSVLPHRLESKARLPFKSRSERAAFDYPAMRKVYGVVAISEGGIRHQAKCQFLIEHAKCVDAAMLERKQIGRSNSF